MDPEYYQKIIQEFPVDFEGVTRINHQEIDNETRLFKVNTEKSKLAECDLGDCYIIDTRRGREIACKPHLVSDKLRNLCFIAAQRFRNILKILGIDDKDGSCILHILRGSAGYMVKEAMPYLPFYNIRTEYFEDSYRDHSEDIRRIGVTYNDFKDNIELQTVIIPDTYATGRSAEAAIKYILEKKCLPENIILYGFIAIPAIQRINKLCRENKMNLTSFAICDITQLSTNHYDMPLFGIDEHHFKQTQEIRRLGSITSPETLGDMLPSYIPGLDQPGDWSERQNQLFNGYHNETGNIKGHLQKTIDYIKSLDSINCQQSWYNEELNHLTKQELVMLRRVSMGL